MNKYALNDVSRGLQRVGCGIVEPAPGKPKREFPASIPPTQIARQFRNPLVIEAILSTAQNHSVSVDEIFGRSRANRVVGARYAAIRAVAKAVEYRGGGSGNWSGGFWSTKAIGDLFGRDHTTICYALGRVTSKSSKRHPL